VIITGGPLGADGWVEIHEQRSFLERKQIEGAAVRVSRAAADGAGDFEEELIAANMKTLELNIVAWSLTDRDGRPIPPTADGLRHEDFPEDVGIWIGDAMQQHYEAQGSSKSGTATITPSARWRTEPEGERVSTG
jgi:hypothetical protein